MDEDEALRSYCGAMMSRLRNKAQQPRLSGEEEEEEEKRKRRRRHKGGQGRERTEAVAGDRWGDCREGDLPPLPDGTERARRRPPPRSVMCQGPEVRTVPLQLISTLRLKIFQEEMRRAAEVELHDPAVCSWCEQEQACLALKTFIWRKKTQLRFQTLKGRLNTHSGHGGCAGWGSWCSSSQSLPMPRTGFGRKYLVKICGSQQPGVALATAKERGVALATDEIRGYPDKSATGTDLTRPGCPLPDR